MAPALLALATLFWSGNFVLGRAMHADIPPMALSFWRWTIAFCVVIHFARPHLARALAALRQQPGLICLLAFLGIASFNALVYTGLSTTTVVNAVLMQSTMPVFIILCSWLIFRESISALQGLAMLISLCGVAVIVSGGSLDRLLHLKLVAGDGWVLLAVLFYALYSALLRKRPSMHPLSFIAITFAIGAVMLLPAYAWEHFQVRRMHIDGPTLASLAYVGVLPSIASYLCFNRAVELIGANRAGQYLHLMPVFGTSLAALLLGEKLQLSHVVGAALIAFAIWLAQRHATRANLGHAAVPADSERAP